MLDIRKLQLFNKMAKQGGDTVADNLTQMTGMEAEMEITKINFIDLPDIQSHVGDVDRVGISVEVVEAPYGYIQMVLDTDSAKTLTDRMVGGPSTTSTPNLASRTWKRAPSRRSATS